MVLKGDVCSLLLQSYLWRCGGGGGPSDRWGGVAAPDDPGHDLVRDVLATLVGVSDTDLGGQ